MRGVITVFLALVFSLILTMLLVVLESAYLAAGRAAASTVAGAATESLFADYFAPLFEEYHVFGVHKSAEEASESYREYVEAMLGSSAWSMTAADTELSGLETLADNDGAELKKQAVDYEKLSAPAEFISKFLGYVGILSGQDDECRLIKKKMNAEKKLADLDKDVIYLMKKIDGISTDDGAMKLTKDGAIGTEQFFVKKIFKTKPDRVTARINNTQVWNALSGSYTDIKKSLDSFGSIGKTCYDLSISIESKREVLKELYAQKEEEQRSQEEGGRAGGGEGAAPEPEESGITSMIEECEKELDEIEESYSEAKKSFKKSYDKIKQLVNCTLDSAKAAVLKVDAIKEKQGGIASSVLDFEAELKTYMSQEETSPIVEELSESLELMKGYAGIGSATLAGLDFDTMKATLEGNRGVLERVKGSLSGVSSPPDGSGDNKEAWTLFESALKQIKSSFDSYSFKGLEFDYSTLKPDTIEDNITGALEDLVAKGLCGLIFPDDLKLSKNTCKELTEFTFGGKTYEEEEIDPDDVLEEEDASNLLDHVNSDVSSSIAGEALDRVLLVKYASDHFRRLYGEDRDPELAERYEGHVLNYEQEFIVCGGKSDQVNLERMIWRLFLMRLPGSLIFCLTDADVRAKSETFAMATVGFAGLPFVVTLVKYLVMIVWASVQALVETAAIMLGKRIDIITGRSIFCVDLKDIPLVATGIVKTKAQSMRETTGTPQYEDYIMFLMLIGNEEARLCRMEALIQENIKDRYDENFRIDMCITSARTDTKLSMRPRYAGGPYIHSVTKRYRY